jgi:formate/nitrite transporter FocA (FNT family)
VVQQCKGLRKFFIVDANIAITIYGESLLTANFIPCTVARGRTEMGLPDMAAFQLLWACLYCMCGCWEGTAVRFFLMYCLSMITIVQKKKHHVNI